MDWIIFHSILIFILSYTDKEIFRFVTSIVSVYCASMELTLTVLPGKKNAKHLFFQLVNKFGSHLSGDILTWCARSTKISWGTLNASICDLLKPFPWQTDKQRLLLYIYWLINISDQTWPPSMFWCLLEPKTYL